MRDCSPVTKDTEKREPKVDVTIRVQRDKLAGAVAKAIQWAMDPAIEVVRIEIQKGEQNERNHNNDAAA